MRLVKYAVGVYNRRWMQGDCEHQARHYRRLDVAVGIFLAVTAVFGSGPIGWVWANSIFAAVCLGRAFLAPGPRARKALAETDATLAIEASSPHPGI